MLKTARFCQLIIGLIPALWILLFAGYLLSENYFPTSQDIINYAVIIMLIIAFHSIWINLLLIAIISIFSRKFVFEKFSLITYIIGCIGLLFIISIDSGKYLGKIFD